MTKVNNDRGLLWIPKRHYTAAANCLSNPEGKWEFINGIAQASPLLPATAACQRLTGDCDLLANLDCFFDAVPHSIQYFFSLELFTAISELRIYDTLKMSSAFALDSLIVVGFLGSWGFVELGALAQSMGSFQAFGTAPFAALVQFTLLEATIAAFSIFLLFRIVDSAYDYMSAKKGDTMGSREHSLGVMAATTKLAQQVLFLASGPTTNMVVYGVFGVVAAGCGVAKVYIHELAKLQ